MRERTGGRMGFDVLEREKEASRWMMGVCVYSGGGMCVEMRCRLMEEGETSAGEREGGCGGLSASWTSR